MNFKTLCESRFSCRAFRPTPISSDTKTYLQQCVQLAPSAVNYQPWLFYWIDQPETLKAVKACYHRDWIESAPAIVICCKNESQAWTRRYDSHNHADIDIAIATEHLCLAATEQGLATCWVCNFDVNQLKAAFPFPTDFEPAVLIPIGYPQAEDTGRKRKPLEEIWK